MSEIKQAVDSAIARYGGLRKAARALKISPSYLCKLRRGINKNASDRVLRKIGLVRTPARISPL